MSRIVVTVGYVLIASVLCGCVTCQHITLFDLDECGKSKGCWRKPEDCRGPKDCLFAVTYTDLLPRGYKRCPLGDEQFQESCEFCDDNSNCQGSQICCSAENSNCGENKKICVDGFSEHLQPGNQDLQPGDVVTFRVYAQMSPGDGWVGLGLSHDHNMGRDSVVECVRHTGGYIDGDSGIYVSYNPERYNSRLTSVDVGQVLFNVNVTYQDNFMACEFNRMKPSSHPQIYSLYNTDYFLFLARGPADPENGQLRPHILPGQPQAFLYISDKKINLTEYNPYYPASGSSSATVHKCFIVTFVMLTLYWLKCPTV